MSLDIYLNVLVDDESFIHEDVVIIPKKWEEVYSGNITHNLNKMADEAGIYQAMWRPDELGISKANELIKPLEDGLARLQATPEYFKQFNPSNGWGSYDGLESFVFRYLEACREWPEAKIGVWR